MSSWKSRSVSRNYLEGVRGAIPLAVEQIDLILRLIASSTDDVRVFLDLGAGDGVLSHALLDHYPNAAGVLVDFSEPMIEQAHQRFDATPYQVNIIQGDYSHPGWVEQLADNRMFDIIFSGFSIHHQPDERKRTLYKEIYDLLQPGGLFLNLEHVASTSSWGAAIFDEAFIDSLYTYQQSLDPSTGRSTVAAGYYARLDQEDNRLSTVEEQCCWLRDIGFERVDCFLKYLELALFGGFKPG